MKTGPTDTPEPAVPDWLDSLLPNCERCHLETRLPAGTIIHRFGSPSRGIFFVKEGTIEISLPGQDGAANTIFQVGPGGAVGLISALFGGPNATNAVVLAPVVGYYVPLALLQEWLQKDPANYLPVAQMLSEWNENAVRILRNGRLQSRSATSRRRDAAHTGP